MMSFCFLDISDAMKLSSCRDIVKIGSFLGLDAYIKTVINMKKGMSRNWVLAVIAGILIAIPVIPIVQALDDVRTDEEEETVIEVWTDEASYSSEKPIIVLVKNVGDETITIDKIGIERANKDPKPIAPPEPDYPPEPTRFSYPSEPLSIYYDDYNEYLREHEEWRYECDRIDYEYKEDYERWEYDCNKVREEYESTPEYKEYARKYREWVHRNILYSLSPGETLDPGKEKSYTCWETRDEEHRGYSYTVIVKVSWKEEFALLEVLRLDNLLEKLGLECPEGPGFKEPEKWPGSVTDVVLIVSTNFRNDPSAISGSIPIFAAYLIEIIPILLDFTEWAMGGGCISQEDAAYSDFYLE